jgi:hypothetical protein
MDRRHISIPIILYAGMFISTFISGALAQEIPGGFKVERYRRLWEHNPFTEAKATVPQGRSSVFEKLFLTSWLIDAGKQVICVQNSETNEVQTVTAESNQNNLHLVGMHLNSNPQFVEAIISDGKEQGTVKYRLGDQHPVGPTTSTTAGDQHPVGPTTSTTARTPNYNAPFGRQSNSTGTTAPQPAVNPPNAQSPGPPASAPVNQRPPHRGIQVFRPGVG